MFRKLIELITEALRNLVKYKTVQDTVDGDSVYNISDRMQDAIDKWKSMYKDEAPWLNDDTGIYSLGIPKLICSSLAAQVLSEMKLVINIPGVDSTDEELDINTRAGYLEHTLKKHFMEHLSIQLEKGMALGGVLFKPYTVNDHIYIDFNYQGQFYPLEFDDDGNITDIAFLDQFVSEGKRYSKIERQTFNRFEKTVMVQNKAYVSQEKADSEQQDLGTEVELTQISRWKDIEPEITIENVEKPLFGFYKVPLANNIDLDCPIGISIFSPATTLIERVDRQFSRLDWEYEGGQLAINVDPTAIHPASGYYGTTEFNQDTCADRLYKALDLGQDDTYHEFAPGLRDANYINGLNTYLCRIEDICGLARGTLSNPESEARTATEVKILKQRTYTTINSNQQALQKAIEDLTYAINVYATLYNLSSEGEYSVDIEWSDSILTDVDTELAQKLQLVEAGIISKAELRSWYTAEDLETAKATIQEMKQEEMEGLDDIFTMGRNSNPTLESAGQEE